ncbi:hypothetical protein Tco_1194985 [Tanacetum coccineum]
MMQKGFSLLMISGQRHGSLFYDDKRYVGISLLTLVFDTLTYLELGECDVHVFDAKGKLSMLGYLDIYFILIICEKVAVLLDDERSRRERCVVDTGRILLFYSNMSIRVVSRYISLASSSMGDSHGMILLTDRMIVSSTLGIQGLSGVIVIYARDWHMRSITGGQEKALVALSVVRVPGRMYGLHVLRPKKGEGNRVGRDLYAAGSMCGREEISWWFCGGVRYTEYSGVYSVRDEWKSSLGRDVEHGRFFKCEIECRSGVGCLGTTMLEIRLEDRIRIDRTRWYTDEDEGLSDSA